MEERSCCQTCNKGCPDFNFDSPKTKQLLKRFEAMNKKDRSELINSICPNKGSMEEASETFESILNFLKNNGGDNIKSIYDKLQESEDYEEEEEEDEDSETESEICNNWDKRKYIQIQTLIFRWTVSLFFHSILIIPLLLYTLAD